PSQSINHFKVISNTHFHFQRNVLEIDLGYQYNQRQELSEPHNHGTGPAPDGTTALQLDLHTYTANLRYKFHPGEHLDIIAGVSAQHQENSRSGFEFLIPNYRVTHTGIYLFAENK